MSNFAEIDSNRLATAKQFNAVAYRLAQLHDKDSTNLYNNTRMFKAILYRFYTESDTRMTHGDVQKFFKARKVPKNFTDMISAKKPAKTSKKSSPKPKASADAKSSEIEDLMKIISAQQAQLSELSAVVKSLVKNS